MRKQTYWQSWLLPSTPMSQSCIELPPSIGAHAYCAMLADTSEILLSNNATAKLEVASLTKIMTAYTVICICNANGIKIR